MYKQLILATLFLSILVKHSNAQIDGDNIFENDQIINIELNFSQVSFWDSLTLNYETETYMKADLILTDGTGTYAFDDVGVRLKGNSSYGHPGNKKSFKIDFNKYVDGQDYDGLKKLNFSNAFKDPSMIREKLFFDMCRTADVPAPRANFANVYFNGTLWGFYTVIEQIDDQFLDWKILDDDGNLFKAGANFGVGPGGGGNEADLAYHGTEQADYEDLYELKSNEDENDWSDLIELSAFIDNSSPADFENGLADHIELQEYLKSAALDNLFSNLDSYTNSARNYYIYHNLTTDKWEWIKWDGNESFGTYTGGPGAGDMTTLALDYRSDNRPLLENIFNSPTLYEQYQREICYLTNNFFNAEYMNPKIDAIKNLVQSSVYSDANKMYTNANFDDNIENNISVGGGPMGGTIYGLKSFIQQRNAFVSSQLDCSMVTDLDQLESGDVSLFPNPFNSNIIVDLDDNPFNSLAIYNYLGVEVYQELIAGKTRAELDLSFLAKGVYFVKLYSDKQNTKNELTLKLIKS